MRGLLQGIIVLRMFPNIILNEIIRKTYSIYRDVFILNDIA